MIKKYGTNGTHLDQQQKALEKLGKRREDAIEVAKTLKAPPVPEAKPEDAAPAAEGEAPAEGETAEAPAETPEATAETTEATDAPAEESSEEKSE